MNQDIKLSEQLKMDHESGDFGNALKGYSERAAMLETLGNKVAEQAALIEKISEKLKQYPNLAHNTGYFYLQEFFEEILAFPSDSKQVLNDWMREQLGDPVGYFYHDLHGDGLRESLDPVIRSSHIPLYKLPECLK